MGQTTIRTVKVKFFLLLLVLVLLMTACASDAATPGAPPSPEQIVDVPDFDIVAYQGEALLGGDATQFARVFEHGKPVVLNFWAGLCPPCRAEMPAFQAIADAYADEVIVVGIDVGPLIGLGSHDDAQQLLHDLGIRYPAAAAVDASPLQLYEVRGMPTTIFFAPNGAIVEKRTGLLLETQLRESIQQLVTPAQ